LETSEKINFQRNTFPNTSFTNYRIAPNY
jgi:hypothetical protein